MFLKMNYYSKIHKHIVLPLWNRFQRQHYYKYYNRVASFYSLGMDQIRELQMIEIKKIIHHAYHNVPYYKNLFDENSIVPAEIRTLSDFTRVPVLHKAELRRAPDMFVDSNLDKRNLIKSGTGGTTDSPIPIYYDQKRSDIKTAEMVYFRKWFGWQLESKVAYIWGAPMDIPNIDSWKFKIMNRLIYRTLYLFASLINDDILYDYVERINNFKPDIIQAYSNPAYLFSSFIVRNRLNVHSPRSVVVTAEPCTSYQRDVIQEAFGCPVYSFYGARESGYIATECTHFRNYHVNCHGLLVEILKNDKPTKPGEIGDVVITDLTNFTMPLIRYKIGDMASISEHPCECGCALPVMNFMAGRETDVFILPDGSMVPGVSLCDRVVEDCEGLGQLQFIQERPERLTVKIVKGKSFKKADLIKLDHILEEYFKSGVTVEKIFVDNIPKEKSGKTRFCISRVPRP